MVAGLQATRANLHRYRDRIFDFVATTCRASRLQPRDQVAIFVGTDSNVGQDVAADIAGPQWVDRHAAPWVMRETGRTQAAERWRGRGIEPPGWPFVMLGERSPALWLAPFDLAPHLGWLWNKAQWLAADTALGTGEWLPASTPPAGAMACIVKMAGLWRLWIRDPLATPSPSPE